MRGRFTKVAVLFLVLALALAAVGVGYAMWSKTLTIDGTVKTGEVNAIFTTATCTDTGVDPGYTKDVGSCEVTGAGTQKLTITITNGYPCYTCDIDFTIDNTGTIPVKVQSFDLSGVPSELTVTWTDLVLGTQIEPDGSVPGDVHIHVEQSALENAGRGGVGDPEAYVFSATITLVQWNEYTP